MALHDDQIKAYKGAISKKGSMPRPSGALVSRDSTSSLGRNVRNRATSTSGAPKSRGSMEGYMHSSNAHLQMNGSGYANPAHQRSRGSRSPANISIPNLSNPVSRSNTSMSNMHDYTRRGLPNSSVRRLAAMTKLNKMF